MKKILLSLFALCAVVSASADTRSWDFTKGADYKDLASDANFTAGTKGRYFNTNALTEEAFTMSDGTEFPMSAGLKFTADAQKIMFGLTANYFFQTNGNVKLIIPNVAKGDTIVIGFCSGDSKNGKTISGNINPELTTTAVSKQTMTTFATEDGDLALSMATTTRIYTLEVKPYVAPAAGECKAPSAIQVGIDPVAKAWKYVIKEGEEGETLSYSTDAGASMTLVNSGDTIAVKPGVTVSVIATKDENKGQTEFTAPEFNKEEKVASPATKSTEISGISYNIPALDNAGPGNGYNVKWRSNQEGNTMTINVNEGFALTKVTIVGKNNFTTGDITLQSLSVDGGESLSGAEFAVFNAAQDEQTITFTGKATKSIVLTFGAVQSSANQFNADVTVDWEFADEAAEAQNAVTFAYNVAPLAVANFEDITMDGAETVKYMESETPSTEWTSGSYTFSTYKDGYGYYYAYAVSNKTTTDGKCAYPYAFESACGGAKSGSNYAIWYDNTWNGGDSIKLASAAKVSGVYVTNMTPVVDAVLNGDGMSTVAGGFQDGDVCTLTFTGYKVGAETGKVDFKLAYAENGTIYYAKDWKWVDLSGLGVVEYVKVSMTSTKGNDWGATTPTYFCMDDFGGEAPATDAEYATAAVSAINTVNADAAVKNGKFFRNGKVIIIKDNVKYNVAGQQMK